MTADEIKRVYSMRDVAARYGIAPSRSGFIQCPFHKGDREASCKLYEHDFHCFGCGANGDIFTFVQMMEHCDFKTAFYSLGGEYKDRGYSAKLIRHRAEIAKKERERQQEKEQKSRKLILEEVEKLKIWERVYRDAIDRKALNPLSDAWAFALNELQKISHRLNMLCAGEQGEKEYAIKDRRLYERYF